LVLEPGDSARLAPQLDLRPARGVQFLSRGTVATVTAAGLVSALRPGEGAVTAVAADAGVIYTVPVVVRGVRVRLGGREGVTTLHPERQTAAEAAVFGLPVGADSAVRWTSSDTAVVTVTADGTLRPRLLGRATVAATSAANPFLRGTLTVDVTPTARPALALDLRGPDGTPLPDSAPARGTVAAILTVDPSAFPSDARVALSLGGDRVTTRALGRGALRIAVPTDARDPATAAARHPNGTRSLLAEVVARDGTVLARYERPLTLRNAVE
jgi:hypothetical protein